VRRQSEAATALLSGRERGDIRKRLARTKAVSALRSATALQNLAEFEPCAEFSEHKKENGPRSVGCTGRS
jgi:hypothetical protein